MSEAYPNEKRGANRVSTVGNAIIRLRDQRINAALIDVSTGGCKLVVENEFIQQINAAFPVQVHLEFPGLEFEAAMVWSCNGVFGCRFAANLSLNQLAQVMATGHE